MGSGYERIADRNGKITHRYKIAAGNSSIQVDRDDDSSNNDINYMLTDALGSTHVVLDANGQVEQTLAFDPCGVRINTGDTSQVNGITDRGYTGHETDDESGLVNMNARIYDPYLGKFLSADPVLPDAGEMQAFNRYAYVLNNPLRYTDPTGNEPATTTIVNSAILFGIDFLGGLFGGGGAPNGCDVQACFENIPVSTLESFDPDASPTGERAIAAHDGIAAIQTRFLESRDGRVDGMAAQNGEGGFNIDIASLFGIGRAAADECNTRRCIFEQAHGNLAAAGLIGNHQVEFIDKFAVAIFDSNNDIVLNGDGSPQISRHDTLKEANLALNIVRNAGLTAGFINGVTTLGSNSSIVFAGATESRRNVRISDNPELRRPVFFSPVENTQFVILHEIQHGKGVDSEVQANRNALDLISSHGL